MNFTEVIEPNSKSYFRDIWKFRDLLYILAWRDVSVRYKQASLGVIWAILKPVITMIIFTVIFDKIAKLPSEGIPYPVYVFSAMLPWSFFSSSLLDSCNSLISNSALVSKVYFPRIVIPMSTLLVSVIDFLISLCILFALMFYYDLKFNLLLTTLPLFLIIALVFSFSIGMYISALTVKYRDFKFIVPFLVQIGLYISPVGFDPKLVPENLKFLYNLNPMVHVITGFRWAISAGQTSPPVFEYLIASSCVVVAFLIFGLYYFRKVEQKFADII